MSSIETVQNLHPEPRCLKSRAMWNAEQTSDGEKTRYMLKNGETNGGVYAWNPITNESLAGKILYARVTNTSTATLEALEIGGATLIAAADGWIASRVAADMVTNHSLWLIGGPLTLSEVGVYSPEDWEKLYAIYQQGVIAYPWVAGPRNATMAGEIGPWEL